MPASRPDISRRPTSDQSIVRTFAPVRYCCSARTHPFLPSPSSRCSVAFVRVYVHLIHRRVIRDLLGRRSAEGMFLVPLPGGTIASGVCLKDCFVNHRLCVPPIVHRCTLVPFFVFRMHTWRVSLIRVASMEKLLVCRIILLTCSFENVVCTVLSRRFVSLWSNFRLPASHIGSMRLYTCIL